MDVNDNASFLDKRVALAFFRERARSYRKRQQTTNKKAA